MKNKEIKHCCKDMSFYLNEKKVGIYYDPIIRGYYIYLRWPENGRQVIYNCPWCGYEFQSSLVDKYYEVLENEYNILHESFSNRHYEVFDNQEKYEEIDRDLPEEFKSDEWWKKRGL